MYIRKDRNRVEVWSDRTRHVLRGRWNLQGRAIPPALVERVTAQELDRIQDRLKRYVCAGYDEVSYSDPRRMAAEDFTAAATWWCSAVRSEMATPDDISNLLVASVRLAAALKATGVRRPRQRPSRAKASAVHTFPHIPPATPHGTPP